MLRLGLPHVNVLTKVSNTTCLLYIFSIQCIIYVDTTILILLLRLWYYMNTIKPFLFTRIYTYFLIKKVDILKFHGPLPFNLDFFTECTNLAPLIRYVRAENIKFYTQLLYAYTILYLYTILIYTLLYTLHYMYYSIIVNGVLCDNILILF